MSSTTPAAASRSLELVDELEPLRTDWTRLAEASRNIFALWEWNELWWRYYGNGRQLRIGVSRRDGEVDAIVPLFARSERPLKVLRLIGHGTGDLLGPICAEDDVEGSRSALRETLAAEPHDIFVGDWVAGDRNWTGFLGGRVFRRTGYPILRFGETSWEAFLESRSSRFRKNARYYRNRLERDHEVTYRYADGETLERDLDEAFRLHEIRFREHHGCLFCGEHEAFQRDFARLALEQDRLRLLLLEVDGEAVCCEYGFYFQDAYFSYQGGRDPAWERDSVGFLVELENLHRMLEAGATEYRYLEGDEGYKYRLPTEDPRLETIVVPATGRGRLAATAAAAARRLPGGRATLRRLGTGVAGLS
jgi:CelD/BcsL family acetyltransferase involved in cellulose biosynthesis